MCSLTYSSKVLISFGLNALDAPFTHYLILDFGSTDHVTLLPKYFSTYSPCPSNKKISTTDGKFIATTGQVEVQISPSNIVSFMSLNCPPV